MLVERFKDRDAVPISRRVRDGGGRGIAEGLTDIGSRIESNLSQIAFTDRSSCLLVRS